VSASEYQELLPDSTLDKEIYIDQLITNTQNHLSSDKFSQIFKIGLDNILGDIKQDLAEFGVPFDEWFHESNLVNDKLIDASMQELEKHKHTYKKEGAIWFRGTDFEDDKDRVLIRANGQYTYFASDVAYHIYKYNQGYNKVIDIFGADHHGYVARVRSVLQSLEKDPAKFNVLLVQFAILYRGTEKVSMSTRGGQFVTLRELREEVGNDAARYFYIMRKPDQHLDFDLELAKSKSNENPVYYIQYAHARICSVWRQLHKDNMEWDQKNGIKNLSLLKNDTEKALLSCLNRYPETIKSAGINYAPHTLAYYLQELANLFHSYYNANKFLVEQTDLRDARLALIKATQQVLQNGLKILGISAPREM